MHDWKRALVQLTALRISGDGLSNPPRAAGKSPDIRPTSTCDAVRHKRGVRRPAHATGGELFARHLAQRFAATDLTVKPVVFICGQQDRENFVTAVRLRRLLEHESATAKAGQAVLIFIWLPRQPALAGCLREETGFISFGECRTSASYQEITHPLRERHSAKRSMRNTKHTNSPPSRTRTPTLGSPPATTTANRAAPPPTTP